MGSKLDSVNVKFFKMIVPAGSIGSETDLDITCRCCICGDSTRDKRKKRLHLFTKKSLKQGEDYINCFRCGFTGNMYSFIKEMQPSLLPAYLEETKSKSFDKLIAKKKSKENLLDKFKVKLDIETFDTPKQFKLVSESDAKFKEYLDKRLPNDIYNLDDIFLTCDTNVIVGGRTVNLTNCIIVPLYHTDGKMYGFQARDIYQKRFYTYIPDANSGYKVFNWHRINKNKTVYIAESVFDALSLGMDITEVTAALGSDIDKNRLNELRKPVFCFDNQNVDDVSLKKTNNLLASGYNVFVWPDLVSKDFNELLMLGTHPDNIKKMITMNIKNNPLSIFSKNIKSKLNI